MSRTREKTWEKRTKKYIYIKKKTQEKPREKR
jgi:hypothetical protein